MKPIYIADDSADQRLLFGYFLKRVNPEYPITFFDRAQPLLDSLSLAIETGGLLPMAIFLDLQMPEMDGFQALKIIMQYNARRSESLKMPVIIYSSYSDQGIIQKCMDAGAFGFMQKPVDLNDLRNLLLLVEP